MYISIPGFEQIFALRSTVLHINVVALVMDLNVSGFRIILYINLLEVKYVCHYLKKQQRE